MKLPTMQTHQAEAAFIRAGYKLVRVTGKHRILANGVYTIQLAHNIHKPIIPITLSKILNRVKMPHERFMECLK